MKIAVFGLGYVGLSNAVLLSRNFEVCAVDVKSDRVELVNKRISPIRDSAIESILPSERLNLSATTIASEALENADFAIVATPTNYDTDTREFDTSSVESVLNAVSTISPKTVVVIKSTVPIGYTREISKKYPQLTILFSPEFLREGKALYDNLHPSRIIVAGPRKEASLFAQLLADSAEEAAPVLICETTEAEAVKLFSNTFLAVRVAFFNELDSYAMATGLDTGQIIRGVSLDPRIGDFYNNPSFGYGGYCLPKDTKQLLANFDDIPQDLFDAVINSNETRLSFITNEILQKQPTTVGIFKLAMKSGSDNARDSATLNIAEKLSSAGVQVIYYDPAYENSESFDFDFVSDFREFADRSDIILTNRYDESLEPYSAKVFTRDLYRRD